MRASQVGEKVCGDPIETESVKALGWSYNARSSTCTPGDKLAAPCIDKSSSCKILFRYHFSSKLQRMATITRVAGKGGGGTWLLVKGSPEAVGRLLAKQPAAYAATYRAMAENGMRVLALAYRPLEGDEVRPSVSFASRRIRSHAPTSLLAAGDRLARKTRRIQGKRDDNNGPVWRVSELHWGSSEFFSPQLFPQ